MFKIKLKINNKSLKKIIKFSKNYILTIKITNI